MKLDTTKRILSLALAAGLTLSNLPVSGFAVEEASVAQEPAPQAEAASGTCGENVSWVLDETGLLTISGTGDMAGYYPNYIRAPWIGQCERITRVVIEPGVTSVGSYAFTDCVNLTSVSIPAGVTRIEAFAFSECVRLPEITIPQSVTEIGTSAFSQCAGLTVVDIPAAVTAIGDYAFRGCTGLTGIWVHKDNTVYSTDAFGVLHNKSQDTLLVAPEAISGHYTVGSAVRTIEKAAFSDCTKLTGVTVPEGVTAIRASAFGWCDSLTSVNIPSTVTSLGKRVFEYCPGLTEITIPKGITAVYEYTFEGCTGLTRVVLPETIVRIDRGAFEGCTGLTEITLPKKLARLAGSAFYGCTGLTSVNIPEKITAIGAYTFGNCTALTDITLPAGLTSIGDYAFGGCKNLRTVVFRGEYPGISEYAFTGVKAVVCYPEVSGTWSEEVMLSYGGILTWLDWSQGKHDLYEISGYRGQTYTHPVKAGHVFAGWYTDSACTQSLGSDVKKGYAFAKFVDERVLSVKWQVSAGTTAATPSTTVRLVTTVDSLNYSTVGFRFRIGDGKWNTRTSSTVYSRIRGGTGSEFGYAPTVFHESSKYFLTRTITGVPGTHYGTTWTVEPFWITLDGTQVSGVTRSFKISDFYNR